MRCDDIIRTCISFYSSTEIIEAKDLLFNLCGDKPKRRRNENRIWHELQDIMDLLKKCDSEGTQLPIFVVDIYNGLPPSSGFEVVAHHIVNLTDEIVSLKEELKTLKEMRMADDLHQQDNNIIQEDLMLIKGELRKINHKLMNEDLRRNSLLLSTLDKEQIGIAENVVKDNSITDNPT